MTDKIKKKDPKLVILIALIAALAAVSAFLVWMNLQQKTEIKEIVEQMEFEKEQLEDEYEELAIQFDGCQHCQREALHRLRCRTRFRPSIGGRME